MDVSSSPFWQRCIVEHTLGLLSRPWVRSSTCAGETQQPSAWERGREERFAVCCLLLECKNSAHVCRPANSVVRRALGQAASRCHLWSCLGTKNGFLKPRTYGHAKKGRKITVLTLRTKINIETWRDDLRTLKKVIHMALVNLEIIFVMCVSWDSDSSRQYVIEIDETFSRSRDVFQGWPREFSNSYRDCARVSRVSRVGVKWLLYYIAQSFDEYIRYIYIPRWFPCSLLPMLMFPKLHMLAFVI